MIRGWWGRWKQRLQAWREPRILKRQADAEYASLASELAQLTGRCLESEEKLDGLTRANDVLVKGAWRDKARLEQLELELSRIYGDVPGLTPGEIERLAILAEECGEAAQAIGKVLRFGWESSSPYRGANGRTNRADLERELGNIRAVVNLMLDAGDVRLNAVQSWQRNKREALKKWTLYQECSMPREEQLAMMRAIADEHACIGGIGTTMSCVQRGEAVSQGKKVGR